MQKGFNSDLNIGGVPFHVQTEDWGFDNPWLVTRVYRHGTVVNSVKTPYSEVLRNRNAFLLMRNKTAMAEAIQEAMRDQHDRTLKALNPGLNPDASR